MTTNLTPEQIERGREFLKDLRANKLKAKATMRDSSGGRCCLCVALDTAARMGAEFNKSRDGDMYPPYEIAEWYGWETRNPILGSRLFQDRRASDLNDGDRGPELSHCEIADAFELEFPQLKQ